MWELVMESIPDFLTGCFVILLKKALVKFLEELNAEVKLQNALFLNCEGNPKGISEGIFVEDEKNF